MQLYIKPYQPIALDLMIQSRDLSSKLNRDLGGYALKEAVTIME